MLGKARDEAWPPRSKAAALLVCQTPSSANEAARCPFARSASDLKRFSFQAGVGCPGAEGRRGSPPVLCA